MLSSSTNFGPSSSGVKPNWADIADNESTAGVPSSAHSKADLVDIESTIGAPSSVHTKSTKENEDGKSDASVSDLETETTSQSRMSKSRPSHLRSSGRKARRRAAHIARAIEKNMENGVVFVPRTHEEFRAPHKKDMLHETNDPSSALLAVRGPVVQCLEPDHLIGHILHAADFHRMTLDERMELKRRVDSYFQGKFVGSPLSQESVTAVENQFIVEKYSPEWQCASSYCTLCSKWSSNEHKKATEHNNKVNELAACNEMVGIAHSMRRFDVSPGLPGPITKKQFRAFWGAEIDVKMGDILRDRLSKGAEIVIKHSKKTQTRVTLSNLRSVGMCAVSYPGSGKYGINGSRPERAIRWEDLEEDEPIEINEEIPDGSGYWPALIINWEDMAQAHGFTAHDYFTRVLAGVLVVYVVCWYQLIDGT